MKHIRQNLNDLLDVCPKIFNTHLHRLDEYPRRDFYLHDLWSLAMFEYYGQLEVEGRMYALTPEYAFLIPPGTHRIYHLDGPCIHRAAHFHWQVPPVEPLLFDCGIEARRLHQDYDQMHAFRATSPKRADVRLWDMLWRLSEMPALWGDMSHAMHSAVREALCYIEWHLAESMTIPQIAKEVGISHNHLIRLFHKELGESPVAYIRRRRMEQAKHLLCYTSLPIKAIASQVGIPDLQHFNKLAHATWGDCPRAIRQAPRSGM